MESPVFSFCQKLDEIAITKSRNAKLEILKALSPEETEFAKIFFDTVFNPYRMYGVLPQAPAQYDVTIPTVEQLLELREKLESRKLTGNAARDALRQLLTCDPRVSKWIKAAFERTIRIGVSLSSIHKLYPGLIPDFEVSLCNKWLGDDDIFKDKTWVAEPKFDGSRLLFFVDAVGGVRPVSRANKPFYNTEHIQSEILAMVQVNKLGACVFDGEALADDWNTTDSILSTEAQHPLTQTLRYKCFDILSMDVWDGKHESLPLMLRKEKLKEMIVAAGCVAVHYVPHLPVIDGKAVLDFANMMLEKGYEGAVIKHVASVYQRGRHDDWLKVKFEDTKDAVIIGYEEGAGMYTNMLGAFRVRDAAGQVFNVGGGYKREQRILFWKDRDSLVGRVLEFKEQRQQKGIEIKSRFPVFRKIRDDKTYV